MSGLFQGLEIGKRSLLTQQLAMFTTSHNIANVNTPGFSRQRVILGTTRPLDLPDGRIGTGVQTLSVNQLRDGFLDQQFRRERNALGAWTVQKRLLDQIELTFAEPQDNTIGDLMSRFWQSWQDLANDPTTATRNAVREQGRLLVEAFHRTAGQLDDLATNLNSEIERGANAINDLAAQIADLNRQISTAEAGGQAANDLRDQRALAIDQLSQLAQVQVEQTYTGAVNVYIGSMELVHANEYHRLVAVPGTGPGPRNMDVVWDYSGRSVQFSGGELDALIQARDTWLPESREALDALVARLVAQVNDLHRQGTTRDGRTGISFFDPLYLKAGTIQLSALAADTSSENIVVGRTGAESDVDIAQALADLAEQAAMPDGRTTLNGFYDSVVSTIGTRSAEARDVTETQTLLVNQLENQRQSVMGASLDEELANMIKFQHAYEAAARVITTMDEALNTVVNGMGIVGR
jgi:flagellar hook-associated protein 1 FlgK